MEQPTAPKKNRLLGIVILLIILIIVMVFMLKGPKTSTEPAPVEKTPAVQPATTGNEAQVPQATLAPASTADAAQPANKQ